MKKFKGTGVAVITPFKNDMSIDFSSMGKIIEHLIGGGVDYLVILGTTGEASTLNRDEKSALTSFAVEAVNKRVPLVVGIGGNNTSETVSYIRQADMEGVDAILSVAPYYNRPNQRGIYQHFRQIASSSPVPVILYNVPSRTASSILPETCLELARDCENIIGIKESSGNFENVMKIVRDKPEGFLVIAGNDMDVLPVIAAGGAGVVSVLANAYPADWAEMVQQALRHNFKIAREIQFRYLEMIELLFADGNPAGVKSVMTAMNLCHNYLRLPLVTVNRHIQLRIAKVMEELSKRS